MDTSVHQQRDAERAGYTRLVFVSLMVGTALEWYDFSVLGQLNAQIELNMFPKHATNEVRVLGYWMVYAIAFLVRPLGSIVFGWVGDTYGRKTTLIATLLLMGCSTTLIGCLPTYDVAGPAAPALLSLLRVCVGMSMGGEYTTGIVYVHEASPFIKKAWRASVIAASCAIGSVLGLVVLIIVQAATTKDQMNLWGWRIPFLAALPIFVTALLLRVHMRESEEFISSKALLASGGGASDGVGASPSPQRVSSTGGCGSTRPKRPNHLECGQDAAGLSDVSVLLPGSLRPPPGPPLLQRVPLAQLLRMRPVGLLMDVLFVAWFASGLYVVYAWMPANLREKHGMRPIASYGMVLTSLVMEFCGILLGGWAARRLPCLLACAVAPPLFSLFALATIAVFDSGSLAGSAIMQIVCLALFGSALGVHASAFVYVYAVTIRSTGFSLAYNIGCALGGTAPLIVTAIQFSVSASSTARFIPALWLLCLSVLASLASLVLLKVAPLVNTCGKTT